MNVSPGDRVGPYEIAAQIDKGGHGVVYRAHDSRLKRDVAHKVLGTDRDSQHDALLREARAVAALNHPHVTEITDGQTLVSSPNWSADARMRYYVAHSGATMDTSHRES